MHLNMCRRSSVIMELFFYGKGDNMSNKDRFKELLYGIADKRNDCDIDGLLNYLETIGFFKAPASTQYHCSFEGGLLQHSLNVYDVMLNLNKNFGDGYVLTNVFKDDAQLENVSRYQSVLIDDAREERKGFNAVMQHCISVVGMNEDELEDELMSVIGIHTDAEAAAYRIACRRFIANLPVPSHHKYDDVSIAIVALLHDVCRAQIYEEGIKNEKVYSDAGKKHDELGNFDWVSKKVYKVVDSSTRDVIGSKGFSAYYAISAYIPLTKEETVALVNQYSYSDKYGVEEITAIMSKYGLVSLLHAADIIATYVVDERDE